MSKIETESKRDECLCTWGNIVSTEYPKGVPAWGVVQRHPDCRAHESLADRLRRWADELEEALPDVLPAESCAFEAIAELRAEAEKRAITGY